MYLPTPGPAASGSSTDWLERVLAAISGVRVTVCGDFCLDCYWLIDEGESEISIETGLPVRHVREQRYSPGGAGNVTANLAALGAREIRTVGVIAHDLFGRALERELAASDVRTDGLIKLDAPWQTPVYLKPCIGAQESSRMDVGAFNTFPEASLPLVLAELDCAAAESDVVIVNQQLSASFYSERAIRQINALIRDHPQIPFVVDSRHWADHFAGAILKVNAHEAAKLTGRGRPLTEEISRSEAHEVARALTARTGHPVFVTRGPGGLLVASGSEVIEEPGIEVRGLVDPVGAGDTVVAAVAAVLGGRGDLGTAVRFANLAASITVRKLLTTGTATPDELREMGRTPDYLVPDFSQPDRIPNLSRTNPPA